MNHSIKILGSISIILSITFSACKKEEIVLPEVTTLNETYVRRTSVTLIGYRTLIETDSPISYGFCWSTQSFPTIDDNIADEVALNISGSPGYFRANVQGLTPGTTYYVRAYATNQDGTGYGLEKNFTTLEATSSIIFNSSLTYNTVSDIDGNIYKTIDIGTQTWMAENLRTTLYSDNSAIPLVTDYGEWEDLTTPGYCWYENNEQVYKNIYGAYYNWYTVNTDKLCPSGWHVPSDEEWKTLEIYLGMPQEDTDSWALRGTSEGLLIKEPGTGNWDPVGNLNGTNESGFTGLPGGLRLGYDNSSFSGEGVVSFWWTSTDFLAHPQAASRSLLNFRFIIYRDTRDKGFGFNVRCIKD